MQKENQSIKEYLSEIGKKGGKKSRRAITDEQQDKMQEAKTNASGKRRMTRVVDHNLIRRYRNGAKGWDRDKYIYHLHDEIGLNNSTIGRIFHITRERVRQIVELQERIAEVANA